jgi:methylenetetrahydrofolate--tRNA-(uracil-5-)-methyltransferase
MNINYGLLPPLEAPRQGPDGRRLPSKERGRAKKRLIGERALADLEAWQASAETVLAAE